MLYTNLGRTSEKVSKVGIGTWQIGSREWGWGKGYGEEQVIAAIRRSIELGVNLIDTAEIYGGGLSETLVGKAIRGMRERVLIATKVWPTHATYQGTIKACERSLRRLGVDVIDLYQVHWPNPLIPVSSTMRAMEELVRRGMVRYIGVSNFSPSQLERAQQALKREEIVSNQIEYSLLKMRNAERLFERFGDTITVIAYSPLAQGLLTGKYGPGNLPRDLVRAINPLFDPHNVRKVEPLLEKLKEVASRHNATPDQVALRVLIHRKNVVAIPGAKDAGQAERNALAADLPLTDREVEEVISVARSVKVSRFRGYLTAPIRAMRALL
jgi:aryl-alcohol dehydrogenase-like predicted oxidoreductase